MSCCLLCVALFAGEDEGRGEGGDVEAHVEESVAVGGEGPGVGCAGPVDVGGLRCRWVGPVVCGLGVEVVRGGWAELRGERGEWNRGQGEIASGGLEDAVVIDGGDVGAGACFGWGRWSLGQDARGDEKSSGLRAEVSAGCGHDERMLPAEEYHGGAGESLTMRWTIGWNRCDFFLELRFWSLPLCCWGGHCCLLLSGRLRSACAIDGVKRSPEHGCGCSPIRHRRS